jgi:hypothetical protein
MPKFKFKPGDIIKNQIKAHPRCEFFIWDSRIFYNNRTLEQGENTDNIFSCTSGPFSGSISGSGFISLYEYNIDRVHDERTDGTIQRHAAYIGPDTDRVTKNNLITPYIMASSDGVGIKFKNVSPDDYRAVIADYDYVDPSRPLAVGLGSLAITGSAVMTSSIHRTFYPEDDCDDNKCRKHIRSLRNVLGHYVPLSPHFSFQRSDDNARPALEDRVTYNGETRDFLAHPVNMISVPSIFYGSTIKRGSVSLKYYITGTLIGELRDDRQNGTLIQVGPTGSVGSGSTAGIIMYNEGIVLLTGSWDLGNAKEDGSGSPLHKLDYKNTNASFSSNAVTSSWLFFGAGGNDGTGSQNDGSTSPGNYNRVSASYNFSFQGTSYVPTLTMFAHAPKGRLNYSNNVTYLTHSSAGNFRKPKKSNIRFIEQSQVKIKNTVSSSVLDATASFAKQTFISKIGIYDENDRLIAVASVAKPVKKLENRDYTFKIKLDI